MFRAPETGHPRNTSLFALGRHQTSRAGGTSCVTCRARSSLRDFSLPPRLLLTPRAAHGLSTMRASPSMARRQHGRTGPASASSSEAGRCGNAIPLHAAIRSARARPHRREAAPPWRMPAGCNTTTRCRRPAAERGRRAGIASSGNMTAACCGHAPRERPRPSAPQLRRPRALLPAMSNITRPFLPTAGARALPMPRAP
jgi:hypothetical protein